MSSACVNKSSALPGAGQVLPLLSSLNRLMQAYISSWQAPPSAALEGWLTQLVVEDDGISVIGILQSRDEDASAEMTAGCIRWWRRMKMSQL